MSAYPDRARLARPVIVLGLVALAAPPALAAQLREVVSKEVSVGRSEATLRLELSSGERLEVRFRDGAVVVDGDVVGSYQPGGDLDAVWRELLGRAVALDDGPLAEALAEWTVPARLSGEPAEVARHIEGVLGQALVESGTGPSAPSVTVSGGDQSSLAQALLRSAGRLGLLDEALLDLDLDGVELRVHVDEDVVVQADEVVEGSLLLVGGSLRVAGAVQGDVVVLGGAVEVLDGGSVSGSLRLADARLLANRGEVGGSVVEVANAGRRPEREVREELREQVRREVRAEVQRDLRNELRGRDRRGSGIMAPLRPIFRGIGGVIENLVAVLVLGLIGAAAIAFGGSNLDVIAETARRAPARAGAVGLAGTFLLIPVWLLGFVALLVSIVGIPVAIAWLPLFPLAAIVAAVVGYLAVARNAGEWLADSDVPWTHWIRKSNSLVTMVGGLLGLMILFVAANVVSMVPFLGFLAGLFVFAGCVVTFAAVQVGFGAVLLTRAGRRREAWSSRGSTDEAWEAAMRAEVSDVDGFDADEGERA